MSQPEPAISTTGRWLVGARWVLLFVSILWSSCASADLFVVTGVSTAIDDVTTEELVELWLGQLKRIRGLRLEVMDLEEQDPARDRFYANVIGKTARQLKAYWAKQVFMGHGFPPKTMLRTEIEAWVADEPNRLCYIEGESIDNASLKILHRSQ